MLNIPVFVRTAGFVLLSIFATGIDAAPAGPWLEFEGRSGPGKGKHIVLVSGDEEYRSEEALPELAKILATHHGFRCTVLFAIDPRDGTINPDRRDNIPGLETLEDLNNRLAVEIRESARKGKELERVNLKLQQALEELDKRGPVPVEVGRHAMSQRRFHAATA